MLDKLKFWRSGDEPPADPYAPTDSPDPLQRYPMPDLTSTDPLRTQDPLQQPSIIDNPAQEPLSQRMQAQGYPMGSSFPGTAQQSPQSWAPQQPVEQGAVTGHEAELILAKLDAIRSELDALHQRVKRIEQLTDTQGQKKYW